MQFLTGWSRWKDCREWQNYRKVSQRHCLVRTFVNCFDCQYHRFVLLNANIICFSKNSGKVIPAAAASLGQRLVLVCPGIVLISRKKMFPLKSRRKSEHVKPSHSSVVCARTENFLIDARFYYFCAFNILLCTSSSSSSDILSPSTVVR